MRRLHHVEAAALLWIGIAFAATLTQSTDARSPDLITNVLRHNPLPVGAQTTLWNEPFSLACARPMDIQTIPGWGPTLSSRLRTAFQGPHPLKSWNAVNRIPGIGPAKLHALQAVAILEPNASCREKSQ